MTPWFKSPHLKSLPAPKENGSSEFSFVTEKSVSFSPRLLNCPLKSRLKMLEASNDLVKDQLQYIFPAFKVVSLCHP